MNIPAMLEYTHNLLISSAEKIPLEHWDEPGVCGVWNVKDVFGHVLTLKLLEADVLQSWLTGQPSEMLNRYLSIGPDRYCQEAVENNKPLPVETIREQLESAHRQVIELTGRISEDDWRRPGTLPWYGAIYSIEDYMVYTDFGHQVEHAAQFAVFYDNLQPKEQLLLSK